MSDGALKQETHQSLIHFVQYFIRKERFKLNEFIIILPENIVQYQYNGFMFLNMIFHEHTYINHGISFNK